MVTISSSLKSLLLLKFKDKSCKERHTSQRHGPKVPPHPSTPTLMAAMVSRTSGIFSSIIRSVAAIQLLRFRTTSMFWATKSSVGEEGGD